MLTKSIITGVLLASLGGGTYYFGEESIRSFLEERLRISRIQKQIIPVKPKKERSGKTVEGPDTSSDIEYTFFKTLTSSNANSFQGLRKTAFAKTTDTSITKPISLKQPIAKTKVSKKKPVIPSKIPVESPQITDSPGYMVQVSSFRELAGAEVMKNQLMANGYSAFLTEVVIPDKGIWYRVYLGKYANREEALEAAQSAKTRNKLSAVIHQVS